MVVVQEKKQRKLRKGWKEIPDYLVYEILDGISVYYRGFQNVLNGKQTIEEIMGYGDLQALLLTILKDYLQPFLGQQYWLIQGDTGVHISNNINPSLDLSIFPKNALSFKNVTNNYITTPPTAVIEVDTKADVEAFELEGKGNYYLVKTQRLLDFGVEEVIWIFSRLEKVMVARPGQPWLTVGWKDEIEVMGQRFTLQQLIDESTPEG